MSLVVFMFESHVLLRMILITHWTTHITCISNMCCPMCVVYLHCIKSLTKISTCYNIFFIFANSYYGIYADGETFSPICSLAINLLNLSVDR